MEIRSIRIDFDKDTLEINGKKADKPVIVTLPGPDGWPIQKMFNPEVKPYEEYGRINIEVNKTDRTIKRAKKLVKLLKKANSLAEELAFKEIKSFSIEKETTLQTVRKAIDDTSAKCQEYPAVGRCESRTTAGNESRYRKKRLTAAPEREPEFVEAYDQEGIE